MDLTERSQFARWLTLQLLLTLVQSLVLALAVRWLLLGYGRSVGIAGTWAVALVAVSALRLQRMALPGTGARRRRKSASARSRAATAPERAATAAIGQSAQEPLAALPETLDRRFRRLARHADRVTYAVVASRHYQSGVRPVLVELADDRLRRHHGIDMTTEPDRARTVIGEDLWKALTTDRTQPPTTSDLDRWLTTLEQLGDESPLPSGRPGRS